VSFRRHYFVLVSFLFQFTKSLSASIQLEMNYQHLYAYLETRPIDELKECMNNIVSLAKKRAAPADQTFETEYSIILNASIVLRELQQLRVAKQIWAQEAISGKF